MPFAVNQGARIFYERHSADGEPVIFISGLGGDMGFWHPHLPTFASWFHVILLDNRGIGRSDAPDQLYTIDGFADDIVCVMDDAEIDRAHVVGFSMGGNIAQSLAVRYPHRLLRLVLAATYAKMNRQAEMFLDAVLSVYAGGATARQMYDLILPWLFSNGFLSEPENSDFLAFDDSDPNQQPLHAYRSQYLAQKTFDSRRWLHEIRSPTLVIAGELDVLAPVTDSKTIAAMIPTSHLRVIPRAGHLFNYEEPQIFETLLLDFLTTPTS